ncbi:MAG: PD-(D/E)XK nuclease family protein, partial [Marmoricola sp.]
AADEVAGRPVTSGGAELVHLRLGDDLPKVQTQDPQPATDGSTPIERQLMQAARTLRDEDFVARPAAYCERCGFRQICPTKAAGTVLS